MAARLDAMSRRPSTSIGTTKPPTHHLGPRAPRTPLAQSRDLDTLIGDRWLPPETAQRRGDSRARRRTLGPHHRLGHQRRVRLINEKHARWLLGLGSPSGRWPGTDAAPGWLYRSVTIQPSALRLHTDTAAHTYTERDEPVGRLASAPRGSWLESQDRVYALCPDVASSGAARRRACGARWACRDHTR